MVESATPIFTLRLRGDWRICGSLATIGHSPIVAEATDRTSVVQCSVYYLPVIALDPRCGGNDQVGALA